MSADSLIGQAPGVAAELLRQAVVRNPCWGFVNHGWLTSKLADALYRTGDRQRLNGSRSARSATPLTRILSSICSGR